MLTGHPRDSPANLVDCVPVGYDLDLLEVRLLELYDVVALFVLYEAPFTHKVGAGGELVVPVPESKSKCSLN